MFLHFLFTVLLFLLIIRGSMTKYILGNPHILSSDFEYPTPPLPFIQACSSNSMHSFLHSLLHVTPLVYRKPQKSVINTPPTFLDVNVTCGHRQSEPKKYDFKTFVTITPKRIYRYQKNIADNRPHYASLSSSITEDNKHHGLISRKANKKIHKIIDWFVLCAKTKVVPNDKYKSFYSFKINFVTLNLPCRQMHSDAYLQKHLFAPFLDWVRKNNHFTYLNSTKTAKCSMYFWRSESQKRGAIHWHLCTDVFIPYMTINAKWNYYLNKLGYIDEFAKKHNHRLPPTTDVHSVRNIKNIAAYLAKYCSKNSKGIVIQHSLIKKYAESKKELFFNRKWNYPSPGTSFYREINSRLWGCSENLSRIIKCSARETEGMELELNTFKQKYPSSTKSVDFVEIFNIKGHKLLQMGSLFLHELFEVHIRNTLYNANTS